MKKKLKDIRKERGITAKHVADNVLCISYNTMMQKESGTRKFTAKEVGTLCEYYQVPITEVEV